MQLSSFNSDLHAVTKVCSGMPLNEDGAAQWASGGELEGP